MMGERIYNFVKWVVYIGFTVVCISMIYGLLKLLDFIY